MKAKSARGNLIRPKGIVIRTTFFDLIDGLIDLTEDDAALIASVRRIFDACAVRSLHSKAPVRLVASRSSAGVNRKARSVKTRPAWA